MVRQVSDNEALCFMPQKQIPESATMRLFQGFTFETFFVPFCSNYFWGSLKQPHFSRIECYQPLCWALIFAFVGTTTARFNALFELIIIRRFALR